MPKACASHPHSRQPFSTKGEILTVLNSPIVGNVPPRLSFSVQPVRVSTSNQTFTPEALIKFYSQCTSRTFSRSVSNKSFTPQTLPRRLSLDTTPDYSICARLIAELRAFHHSQQISEACGGSKSFGQVAAIPCWVQQ